MKKEPNVEFGLGTLTQCVKYDYDQIFGQDSIYEDMVDCGPVLCRDSVLSCVWTKRERPFG